MQVCDSDTRNKQQGTDGGNHWVEHEKNWRKADDSDSDKAENYVHLLR